MVSDEVPKKGAPTGRGKQPMSSEGKKKYRGKTMTKKQGGPARLQSKKKKKKTDQF